MALLEQDIAPAVVTYEQYLAEGIVCGRYDIIDGVRFVMPNPTALHQEIAGNIYEALRAFQRRTKLGRTFMAPRDVCISVSPLRVRQPDVLFITHERIGGQPLEEAAPFPQAPELVVEVLSDSDTRTMNQNKIRDFCMAGVRECWLVGPEGETVEVLRLSPQGQERVAIYGTGDTLQSITFAAFTMPVADIFAGIFTD